MKNALVIGASGGMGFAIVNELVHRGIQVTAFARGKEKLEKLFQKEKLVTIRPGDVFHLADLKEAANGVDVVFHAMNIPYVEWETKLPMVMSNILQATKDVDAKLAIVDNIYAYGKNPGTTVSENTPKKPHTKKGKIRLQLEGVVKESGVPSLIAHFPDFYGPNATNTILNYTFENVVKNKRSLFVGDMGTAREYIYTPDGAKALVDLALLDSAYGENWNIPGSGVITGAEIVEILRDATGYSKKVSTVTKGMVRFLGLYDKNMREVVEMLYLTDDPVVLDGTKFEKALHEIPKTPYEEGIKRTIESMRLP